MRSVGVGSQTTTCTYHCSACGLHFHSLEAFDAHRTGAHSEPVGSEGGRRCLDPVELDGRLVMLSDAGECRTYPNDVKRTAAIWTVAGKLARMRDLRGSQRSAQAEKAAI
jgi:hypothetical protein